MKDRELSIIRKKTVKYIINILKEKDIHFKNCAPKYRDVVEQMILNGLVNKKDIENNYKDILDIFYENNKDLIYKNKNNINCNTLINKDNIKAVGYKQRCNKSELFDLNPEVFYKSWRWNELRLVALNTLGRRCCCCGAFPSPDNKVTLHVDHIKPLRNNPNLALNLNNLQVLCSDCNKGKSWFNTNDYRTEEQKNKMIDKDDINKYHINDDEIPF